VEFAGRQVLIFLLQIAGEAVSKYALAADAAGLYFKTASKY
jgi:hypothetical protein